LIIVCVTPTVWQQYIQVEKTMALMTANVLLSFT